MWNIAFLYGYPKEYYCYVIFTIKLRQFNIDKLYTSFRFSPSFCALFTKKKKRANFTNQKDRNYFAKPTWAAELIDRIWSRETDRTHELVSKTNAKRKVLKCIPWAPYRFGDADTFSSVHLVSIKVSYGEYSNGNHRIMQEISIDAETSGWHLVEWLQFRKRWR